MEINVGDIIGQVLREQGVKFLFALCGGHISPILTGANKEGIRIIDVRDEVNAVFAADAVGRLTDTPVQIEIRDRGDSDGMHSSTPPAAP